MGWRCPFRPAEPTRVGDHLQRVNFNGADLEQARLHDGDYTGAQWEGAELRRTRFSFAGDSLSFAKKVMLRAWARRSPNGVVPLGLSHTAEGGFALRPTRPNAGQAPSPGASPLQLPLDN